jgi:hypothetical protein
MANDPPFATLNHFAADLGIPSESDLLRIGIRGSTRRDFVALQFEASRPNQPCRPILGAAILRGHAKGRTHGPIVQDRTGLALGAYFVWWSLEQYFFSHSSRLNILGTST